MPPWRSNAAACRSKRGCGLSGWISKYWAIAEHRRAGVGFRPDRGPNAGPNAGPDGGCGRPAASTPASRHRAAGAGLGEVFAKHLAGILAAAAFDQKAREMHARDQRRVADELQCAFVSAPN